MFHSNIYIVGFLCLRVVRAIGRDLRLDTFGEEHITKTEKLKKPFSLELPCPSGCMSVPSGAVFFQGLSSAPRSQDQFQASQWSSPPFFLDTLLKKLLDPFQKKCFGPQKKVGELAGESSVAVAVGLGDW